MKRLNKVFITGTAFAISAMSAFSLTACKDTASNAPERHPIETVEQFTVDEEINPEVYGPPTYFEDETFKPEEEVQPLVYGPPEYFQSKAENNSDETK